MDETDAVDALSRLGLSTYEARVFIALQKLGSGTASDVADISEVPRSQVYGAADSLEDRGLLEVQHATPLRYRPVPPTEADTRLAAPLEAERERAVEYLETVYETGAGGEKREAEVWTVHGKAAIDDRLAELVGGATDHVYLGIGTPDLLPSVVEATMADQVTAGVGVTLVSAEDAVLKAAPTGVSTVAVPPELDPGDLTTRVVVVDASAVLVAVRDEREGNETAIWSADTGFATVMSQAIEAWFATLGS